MSVAKTHKAIKLAEMLMALMQTQRFENWYETFNEMLSGSEQGPKESEVKAKLAQMIMQVM